MDVMLDRIRGLDGKVLKPNVDVDQTKLLQETLTKGVKKSGDP